MAGIAEVEVDKATGKVTVVDLRRGRRLRHRHINEALARVQSRGRHCPGYRPRRSPTRLWSMTTAGRLRTGNFMSYKLPTCLDIGSISRGL